MSHHGFAVHAGRCPAGRTLSLSLPLPLSVFLSRRGKIDAGLLDELAGLRAAGYAADSKAFAAIGYLEAGLCLDGRLAAEDLTAVVARATRNYAKRQLIWIRGQMQTVAVTDMPTAFARADEFLQA